MEAGMGVDMVVWGKAGVLRTDHLLFYAEI
jgi:hypothetical protein